MTSGLEGVRGLVARVAQLREAIESEPDHCFGSNVIGGRAYGVRENLLCIVGLIEAALAAEGVQAGEVEQRARELLAAEWEVEGYPEAAKMLRAGWTLADEDAVAIRAIIAALSQQPEARGVVDEAMVERAYQAWRKAAVAREGNKPAIRAALTAALTEASNVR